MNKIIILSISLILFTTPLAYGYYTTTLDFSFHSQNIVTLWDEYTVQINTHDQKYYRDIPFANITVVIDGIPEKYGLMEGVSTKHGYFADSILLRNSEFDSNVRYNVTITAQWNDQIKTEKTYFWTTIRGY